MYIKKETTTDVNLFSTGHFLGLSSKLHLHTKTGIFMKGTIGVCLGVKHTQTHTHTPNNSQICLKKREKLPGASRL